MSGRVLRLVCTAAVAAQAALAPTAATAVPQPLRQPLPLPQPQPQPVHRPQPLLQAQPLQPWPYGPAGPLRQPGPSGRPGRQGQPGPSGQPGQTTQTAQTGRPVHRSTAALLTDFQTLYRQAVQAATTYNTLASRLKKQRVVVERLDADLARARSALRGSMGDAGRLARLQYQGSSDFSPYLRLLLARDPQQALEAGQMLGRLSQKQAGTVGRLAASERKASELARAARTAYDAQLILVRKQQRARDEVRKRLLDVEKLLASLSARQLAALTAAEQSGKSGISEAQRELLAAGALVAGRPPSEQGEKAVSYAVGQLGKPYVWGAEGPDAYDCSGLTSRAWEHAGTPIPRTSQAQWAQLKRVPLNDLRPGDLVVYFPGATHVALYLGGGMVVQAPRPGARVKVSPLASNPVLGAVRPDPDGKPLRRYVPPRLPKSALRGSDAGYYAAGPPATSAR
ncbi:C40 family peptidase [Streptomyces sp. NRRL S-813]|uniref:C40 family peptidase n=1 Tax=Streptomyces sp. NRRL S-813 TaxID=1463919 RepID=UPI00099C7857